MYTYTHIHILTAYRRCVRLPHVPPVHVVAPCKAARGRRYGGSYGMIISVRCMCIHIYIYIYGEREREIRIHMYIYIYILFVLFIIIYLYMSCLYKLEAQKFGAAPAPEAAAALGNPRRVDAKAINNILSYKNIINCNNNNINTNIDISSDSKSDNSDSNDSKRRRQIPRRTTRWQSSSRRCGRRRRRTT